MILPERAFGSSATTVIRRGFAIGPISLVPWLRSSWTTSGPTSPASERRITKAAIGLPVAGSDAPTTAASATVGARIRSARVTQHREDGRSVP